MRANIVTILLLAPCLLAQIFDNKGPTQISKALFPDTSGYKYYYNGAANQLLWDPNDGNRMWIATVSGGIWYSSNAQSANPTYIPLTDSLLCSTYKDIKFDVSDNSTKTILAACGDYSSSIGINSLSIGVIKSTDGGQTWQVLNLANFNNKRVSSVYSNNQTIVAGVSNAWGAFYRMGSYSSEVGIFRSTDGGATFTRSASVNDHVEYIIHDPLKPNTLYAATVYSGIYRSNDTGATWTQIAPQQLIGAVNGTASRPSKIFIALHSSTQGKFLWAMTTFNGQNVTVWRSDINAGTWTRMDTPSGVFYGEAYGLYTLQQGWVHGAIKADPTDPNLVYVSGDATPITQIGETLIGATGNIMLGNFTQPSGSQWTPLINTYASGTYPHSDSRCLHVDPQGNLLHCCDGGVFKLKNPKSNGTWMYIGGNIRSTEMLWTCYNPLNNLPLGGCQDNGSPFITDNVTFSAMDTTLGDGQNCAVDTTDYPNSVLVYTCSQSLGLLKRFPFYSNGSGLNNLTANLPQYLVPLLLDGQQFTTFSFGVRFELNSQDPMWFAIPNDNTFLESNNRGDTLTQYTLNDAVGSYASFQPKWVYGGKRGGVSHRNVVYLPVGNQLFFRDTGADSIDLTYDFGESAVILGVAANPNDYNVVFALVYPFTVMRSTDNGNSWTDVTGQLSQVAPTDAPNFRLDTLELVPLTNDDVAVIVGGKAGAWVTQGSKAGTWALLQGIPRVMVTDIKYSSISDVVVCATQGRGFWVLSSASGIFNQMYPDTSSTWGSSNKSFFEEHKAVVLGVSGAIVALLVIVIVVVVVLVVKRKKSKKYEPLLK